jgi:hypothetical protein
VEENNKKNAKNAPPLLSGTLALTKGKVGVKGKVLGFGSEVSATKNGKDIIGMRDNKLVHTDETRNGMALNTKGFGGETTTTTSKNGSSETETKVTFAGVTIVRQTNGNGQLTYSGEQVELFSFSASIGIGIEGSLTINLPSVSSIAPPPPDGIMPVNAADNTQVRIYVPAEVVNFRK